MGVTKKAKKCKMIITEKPTTRTAREYQCPSCKGYFKDWQDDNATRIMCNCGQELILEKVYVKAQLEITDKEAMEIAIKIQDGGFFMAGYGHFSITLEDYAEIIKLAINNGIDASEKIGKYYDKISPLR